MNPEILVPTLSIIVFLFSVIIHEVMHGYVALRFGDRTAENAGRLTLNPLPHIDPIGSILLPALLFFSGSSFLIGWAKPVPVNPLNFSNLRKGELFVSLAGVLANFSLALIFALLYHILSASFGPADILIQVLKFGIVMNLSLGIFNLVPIPPLDGSKVLLSQLPYNLAKEFAKFETIGPFILLILLYLGVLSPILGLIIRFLLDLLQIPLF